MRRREQELLRAVETRASAARRCRRPGARGRPIRRPRGARTCVRSGAPRRCTPRAGAGRCRPRTRRSRPGGGGASRVGDRVPAIEGVGDVDEPALLADRRERVRERHALAGSPRAGRARSPRPGPSSSPPRRESRQVARRAPSSTASSAPAKTLWSVTAIAPSPSASAWSRSSGDRDRAVVRPARVHVQVGDDPVAVGERLRRAGHAPARPERRVDPLQLGGDRVEGLALGARAGERRLALAESRHRRSGGRRPRPRARAGR